MASEIFIARQPLLDNNNNVFGYELLFRRGQQSEAADFNSPLNAGSTVLLNILSNLGQDWLLDDKIAFINVEELFLQSSFLDLLIPEKTVFEITPNTIVSDKLLETILLLKSENFKFALDDCAHLEDKKPLISLMDYIKIDCQRTGMIGLLKEIKNIKLLDRNNKFKIVVQKIETMNEFKTCKDFNVDLYQGYYFSKPQIFSSKTLSPNFTKLTQLLELTRNDGAINKIEELLKTDPALSYKILRYINSAGLGLSCEIKSLKHAISILGYKKLHKWITLLLLTVNSNTPSVLIKDCIIRARFLENVGKAFYKGEELDNLFITGMFSMLDIMFGVPMKDVLPSLNLSEEVNDALLNACGPYYDFLLLAKKLEEDVPYEDIEMLALGLGLTPTKINTAHIEAMKWVNRFEN